MTAKTPGAARPCTKRQKIIADKFGDSATITVGIASITMATTMTRLRPSTSATVPANGAISATASVLAVMMVAISAGPTPNSCDSSGRMACGEYMLTNVQ